MKAVVNFEGAGWASATLPGVFLDSAEYTIQFRAIMDSVANSWIMSVDSAGLLIGFMSANLPRISFGNGNGWSTFNYSDGRWRFVYDASLSGFNRYRAFRNNVEQARITTGGSFVAPNAATGLINFGRRTTGVLNINGRVGEISIWDRKCLPSDSDQITGRIVDLGAVSGTTWTNRAGSPNFTLGGDAALFTPRGSLLTYSAANNAVDPPYRHRHSIDEVLIGDRVPTTTDADLYLSVWFRRDPGNSSVTYEIIAREPGAWSLSYQPSTNTFRWQVIGVEQDGYYGPFEPELDMPFDAGESLDQWTHVVVGWSAITGAGQAWVDGLFMGVVPANDEFTERNAGSTMQIGGLSHASTAPPEIRDLIIQPDLSSFLIGGMELIGEEFYQRFRGRPSGMAAYYRFRGDVLRKLQDSSGNDLHLEY